MPGVHYKMNELSNRILRTVSGARVKLSMFPSGELMLDVWRNDRVFVMACLASGRIGVDEILEDEGFNMGYHYVFNDFESASAKLLQLVAAASAKTASELKFGT